MSVLTAIFAAAFALIHLSIDRVHVARLVPRSQWFSAAGGVAVAYVFLHILPELSALEGTLAGGLGIGRRSAEAMVYLASLAGLVSFYGLERAAKASREQSRSRGGQDAVGREMFRIHIGSFGLYNVLIGYLLLHREESGFRPLVFYFIAMSLHFVTTDFSLREDHKERYDRIGRWVLAVAVIAGWSLGVATTLPRNAIAFLFAFLAGGIVLNVLKEELPEERKSRFLPFALGGAAYAALSMLAG